VLLNFQQTFKALQKNSLLPEELKISTSAAKKERKTYSFPLKTKIHSMKYELIVTISTFIYENKFSLNVNEFLK
jgi:hypothetical protein